MLLTVSTSRLLQGISVQVLVVCPTSKLDNFNSVLVFATDTEAYPAPTLLHSFSKTLTNRISRRMRYNSLAEIKTSVTACRAYILVIDK
jgi:hypothetical protein